MTPVCRIHIAVSGIVQGVGFRPFLHRLAQSHQLNGWVRNTSSGVELELEGSSDALDEFVSDLRHKAPPLAVVEDIAVTPLEGLAGYSAFTIRDSRADGGATLVSPDIAPCPACLKELYDPSDRRYRYPFINCTDCGPRFTIIRTLPYDRPGTSMARFAMCPDCAAEYRDIATRRYHAQPDCCPVCGPGAFYLDNRGIPVQGDPVALAQQALAAGGVIAVKGAGGIHLACDARNPDAVRRLRRRKHREEKPLAVMCRDLDTAKSICRVDADEAAILQSVRRPILLLQKKDPHSLPELSANARVGVMLPYTPLHVLLLDGSAGGPAMLVMTSANLPGRPVMVDNEEALQGLHGIADGYLLHNRDIVNRCDDSLAAVWRGREYFFRRSRGYAPQPVTIPWDASGILAFGAEQKASFAAGREQHAFLSQHVGDLKNAETLDHYRSAMQTYLALFSIRPSLLVCDLHPDYFSTREAQDTARQRALPLLQVQHHWAHMAACMADNRLEGEVFGILWDGTGLGTDGTIWGGEFFIGGYKQFCRVGSIRPVRLPGGDAATQKIGRIALSLAWDAGLDPKALSELPGRAALLAMLEKGVSCPSASSIGRLFDGVYSLLSGRQAAAYDGQAPTLLEAMADDHVPGRTYPVRFYEEDGLRRFDTRPLIRALCADLVSGLSPSAMARGFMDALCRMALEQCRALNSRRLPVVLSGGVFLNQYLLSGIIRLLEADGFRVYPHCRVSPGDEGLCLGQLAIAAAQRSVDFHVSGSSAENCIR